MVQGRHRFELVLATGVTILLAAACSGGSSPTSSHQPATTTTAVPVNPAADRTTAQHINLMAADLPGWQESPNPPDASSNALAAKLAACTGAPDESKIDVVDVTSSNFDQGHVEISSDVTMVRTHADGVADVQAINSPKLPGCVTRIALPAIRAEVPAGVTVKSVDTSHFSAPGHAPGAFGLRLSGTMTGTQNGVSVTLPYRFDQVAFLVGRAEVTLLVAQVGQLTTVSAEPGLVDLLYRRATANPS